MPRIPKTTEYTADDETILAHFDESLELAEEQKASRAELATHNKRMYADGVDSGTLSVCRKLALMKPGKRGIAVALLHRYLEVLASRLEDPDDGAAWRGAGEGAVGPFRAAETVGGVKRCLFCLTPLANGSATCSATCEAGWLRLMPPVSVYRDPERVQRDRAAGARPRGQGGLGCQDGERPPAAGSACAAWAVMTDVDKLKLAIELAIRARRNIDRACELVGRERLTNEELRQASPGFCDFERVAPAGWVPLIELVARGDDHAAEQLDAECELAAGGPVH